MVNSRFPIVSPAPLVSVAVALLLGGCAYDGVSGQAPYYPQGRDYAYDEVAMDQYGQQAGVNAGWDGEWNPAWTGVEQPGDLFGGEDVESVEQFYEPLAPFGRWLETRWGRAFAPDIGPDWRPYTNGRWTEYRLWISDDPWGWATDHYGRWAHDDQIGWVWVPDTRWGPHWVAFRENEQYAGWAPVPPGVQYEIGVGFGGGGFGGGFGGGGFGGGGFGGGGFGFDNWNSWYGPSWVWAPANVIFLSGLNRRILPFNRGFNYWQQTRWQSWTPWQRGRGWIGAPGQNYWRGASPISNRIGNSIGRGNIGRGNIRRGDAGGARPGFNNRPNNNGFNTGAENTPRRPQYGWNRPAGDRADVRGNLNGRPNSVIGDRPGRPQGQRDTTQQPRFGYGQRPAYEGGRPDRQRADGQPPRQRWNDTPRAGMTPGLTTRGDGQTARSRDFGDRNVGNRGNRQPPASPIGTAIADSMGRNTADRQAQPQTQPQAQPQAQARQQPATPRQADTSRNQSYRGQSNNGSNISARGGDRGNYSDGNYSGGNSRRGQSGGGRRSSGRRGQ